MKKQKKAPPREIPCVEPFKPWCARRDLNPYVVDTRTSNVPVCQFQHSRITNARYYIIGAAGCQHKICLKQDFFTCKETRKIGKWADRLRCPAGAGRRPYVPGAIALHRFADPATVPPPGPHLWKNGRLLAGQAPAFSEPDGESC